MASSTRCWTSPRPARRPEPWLRTILAALCLLLAVLAPARAEQGEVTQLRLQRTDEGILLSAALRFELPPAVDEALGKGIPMHFVAEAVLLRERWYWYDKAVAQAHRHMRLSFQPLTRRWRLLAAAGPIGSSGLALGQTFDTRDEALRAVQSIAGWKIADLSEVDPDARHTLEFRFRLDMSQLPRPLQIGAVGQSEWSVVVSRTQRAVFETGR